jgi:hypothetical protein
MPPAVLLQLLAAGLLLLAGVARAGDPHYSFDDYWNTLPLPNGPVTNGSTMLVLPARLNWTFQAAAAPPEVLVAATKRYDKIIFAWGAPGRGP